MFLRNLPFYLIILLLDIPSISASGFVSRALQRAQHAAALHTRSLARDLRITFGSVLVSQDSSGSSQSNHVVYCKVPTGLRTGGDTGSDDDVPGDRPSSTAISNGPTRTRSSTTVRPSATQVNSPWKLQDTHAGRTFFDQWDWHVGGDPTFGIVDYIGPDAAWAEGLVSVNDAGNAIMRLETTERVPANRRSVRIHSKKIYNGGMFVLDAIHMPYGCGTWPAFWTNGPDWPNNGEIDILEGVHDYSNNQATLHTRSGCSIPSRDNSVVGMKGSVLNTNCGTRESGNQACGTRSSSNKSLGVNFNRNGGGVYVMTWDENGIANYFFEPENIPSDLLAETPLPGTWGLPQARWPASSCAPFDFFKNHIMIFDTTLCGQWAGAVWNVGGIPGQEESCAARTGYATCEEFVRNNGHTLIDAYWEVKSVKVYIKS